MTYGLVTHVAILVPDLVDAEEFYSQLFDTNVNYRQTTIDGEWFTLEEGMDWPIAEEAGYEPRMSFIQRDDFFLALTAASESDDPDQAQYYHIGLQMSEKELDTFLHRSEQLGCEILYRQNGGAMIEDVFGFEWDIDVEWSSKDSGTPRGPWITEE